MDDTESVAVNRVIESLGADYPEVPHQAVVDLVQAEHARYAARPIRDYIPVLVEHAVRERLRGPAPAPA